jgi:hypothetical protein
MFVTTSGEEYMEQQNNTGQSPAVQPKRKHFLEWAVGIFGVAIFAWLFDPIAQFVEAFLLSVIPS